MNQRECKRENISTVLNTVKAMAFWKPASTHDHLIASVLHCFVFHFYVIEADRRGTSWQLMISAIDPANQSVTGNI